MKWLAATAILIGASAALMLGIFLRDRDTSWRPSERVTAEFDAHWVLAYVAGPTCGRRCSYTLLAHPRGHHWVARIVDRSRAECVDIDLTRFNVSSKHGVAGIDVVNCGPFHAQPDA
ncbi:MAG TPA: hypothetical protein VGH67_06700 [Solirubrobacteraceae bacterium]|jgi:hypothetical protein